MKKALLLLIVCLCGTSVCQAQEKQIFIPEELRANDFNNDESQWSYSRMAQTPNVVLFWERGFGPDLSKAPELDGHPMTVDLQNLLSRIEYFYQVYRDMMRFTLRGSKAEKYKMMVMLKYSLEGTAYGGSYDDTIGALWIAPNRVQDKRLNCIAHELGHSFQIQVSCDGKGQGIGGGIYETAAQWMLWQVNPNWVTDELYHWQDYIKQANLSLFAPENMYHAPYMLEEWSMKRGLTVMADLFRETRHGEDVCQAYMRMYDISVEELAREAVDCYSRLLSFDFPGKQATCRRYAGQFVNDKPLHTLGANVVKLETKSKNVSVRASLKTKNGALALRLVALNAQGEPTYGETVVGNRATTKMRLPEDAAQVFLVITGYQPEGYRPASGEEKYEYELKVAN